MGNFDKFEKRRGGGGFGGGHKFSAKGGPASGWGGRGNDRHGGGPRPMFQATCSKCGQGCEVPFKPTSDRPVFCNNCFKSQGGAGGAPRFAPKSFGNDNRANANVNTSACATKGQFDALNAKLDRIISLLGAAKPVEAPKVKPLEIKEIIKKVKASSKKAKSKRK